MTARSLSYNTKVLICSRS